MAYTHRKIKVCAMFCIKCGYNINHKNNQYLPLSSFRLAGVIHSLHKNLYLNSYLTSFTQNYTHQPYAIITLELIRCDPMLITIHNHKVDLGVCNPSHSEKHTDALHMMEVGLPTSLLFPLLRVEKKDFFIAEENFQQ